MTNKAGGLVPDLQKLSIKWKEVVYFLVSICFGSPRLAHTIKADYETSECWSSHMLNFDFLKKGLGLAPHHILCMIFQENILYFCHIIFY